MRFRDLIKNKNFVLLWVGQVISQFGDRLNQMALIALVFQKAPGSTTQLANLMGFTILPVFLVGPIAGVYVDRWDQRRTMFICDFIRSVLVGFIPFCFFRTHSLIPIYAIVFLVFCLSRFFVPAKMSIIPDLVKSDDLLLANSMVNTTGMIASALGFGIGGIIVEKVGAQGGFYVNSLTFFISGTLLFLVSVKRAISVKPQEMLQVGKDIVDVIKKSVAEEIKDVFVFLRGQKNIISILTVLFMLWAALGSIYVVVIVFIQRVFESVVKDLGLLAVFLGCGLFIGSVIYGRFGRKVPYFRAIFISLILSGIMLIVFTMTSYHFMSFTLAATLAFLLGTTVSPIMIASNTLIHILTDSEMRGRIFTALEIVVHLAFLSFMFFASHLADRIGQYYILMGAGVFILLLGCIGLFKKEPLPAHAEHRRAP